MRHDADLAVGERLAAEPVGGEEQQLAGRALGDDAQGPRRWHFETSAGYLPFLPVNEMTARRLQGGELAIVADPNASWPRYVIVPREVGLALKRLDGERVRFLAGA